MLTQVQLNSQNAARDRQTARETVITTYQLQFQQYLANLTAYQSCLGSVGARTELRGQFNNLYDLFESVVVTDVGKQLIAKGREDLDSNYPSRSVTECVQPTPPVQPPGFSNVELLTPTTTLMGGG